MCTQHKKSEKLVNRNANTVFHENVWQNLIVY